jgi:hypothetical protein
MQVTDLIRYNHVVRGLYFDAVAKLSWAQVVEPRVRVLILCGMCFCI